MEKDNASQYTDWHRHLRDELETWHVDMADVIVASIYDESNKPHSKE
jgi:hypothetical protein